MRFNLLQYVVPEVKEVYNWLEVDFHPLKLSGRVTKVNNLVATSLIMMKTNCPSLQLILYSFHFTLLLGVELGERPG